jgi:hypothetical protein
MIRLRVRHLPAVTAMGLLAQALGIDAAAFWEMSAVEFVAAVNAARRRRVS